MKIKGEGGVVWAKHDGDAEWYKPGAEEAGRFAAANGFRSFMEFMEFVEGKAYRVDDNSYIIRSWPEPAKSKPAGFPIEANGAANIFMHIEAMQRMGRPVDLAFVKQQALMTAQYIQQLDGTSPVQWFDFVKNFKEKP